MRRDITFLLSVNFRVDRIILHRIPLNLIQQVIYLLRITFVLKPLLCFINISF